MGSTWTTSDPRWLALDDRGKAAAMALMEANAGRLPDAMNAAGAMVNRSAMTGEPLGQHVSRRIYQPTIEPSQQARLGRILASPEHSQLSDWIAQRQSGAIPDPVNGATHFLAKPQVMLALEARQPSKYKNWGPRGANWTGYNSETGQYSNQVFEDSSHAFLTPDGKPPQTSNAPIAASAPDGVTYRAAGGGPAPQEQSTGGGEMAGPVLQQQVQKSANTLGIELPDASLRRLADSLQAGARASAANARDPWGAAGAIAQSAVGAIANYKAGEQEKGYNKTLSAALAGATDTDTLMRTALGSGDPELQKLGFALRMKSLTGESPQAQADLERTRAETARIRADTVRKEQPAAMTVDQRKATLGSDQAIKSADSSLANLNRMMELNDKAYSGPLAGTRGYLASQLGMAGGNATEEFSNTALASVLSGLKDAVGTNPTEGERKVMEQLAGSVSQAPAVRKAIIQRAIDAIQVRRAAAVDESRALREGTYFKPGTGPAYGEAPRPATQPAQGGGWTPQVESVQPAAVKTFRVDPMTGDAHQPGAPAPAAPAGGSVPPWVKYGGQAQPAPAQPPQMAPNEYPYNPNAWN